MMRNFLIHNLDYIYLFYGAAFLLLGTASLVFYLREKHKKTPTLAWGCLVLFGFLHGFNEWFDMVVLSCADSSCWLRERNIILGLSFLFLFEFFRRSLYLLKNAKIGFWVYIPFVALTAVFNAGCFPCFESSIRYALGLPAALGASYIFWIFSFQRDLKLSKRFCRGVSFLFFLYAFGSGLVVPLSHHWLSHFLNNDSFFVSTGFPIQFFRGFVVTIIAFLFFYRMTKATLFAPGAERGVRYVKIIASSFFLLYLTFLSLGFFVVAKVEDHERGHIHKAILSDARLLINALTPLELSDLSITADESDYPKYRQVHERMNQLSELSPFVNTLYLVSFKDDQPVFVVGSLPQVFPHNVVPSFGTHVPAKVISDALHSKQPTLAGPYRDAQGRQAFSVFVPLLDKKGEVNSLLGIDLDSQQIYLQTIKVRLYAICMVMVFLLLLIFSYAFLIIFFVKSLELEIQKNNLDKVLMHLKEAEAELAKSEETFRGILNNSPNAIFGFDRDLRLIFWNGGAERLYGYLKDEVVNEKNPLLSKRFVDLFGIQAMALEIDRVFQGSTFWHEALHQTKSGSVDVNMTAFPVKDPQGHILFGMGLSQDISEHARFEAQLAKANAQLRSVLDGATHVAIMAADLNGIVTVYNTGAERIFGYRAQEVLGKSITLLLPVPAEIKKFEEEIGKEFGRPVPGFEAMLEYARQGKVLEKEWMFLKKDGQPVPVEVTIMAQRNERGALIGFVGIGVDRSRHHEAQKALLASEQKYKDLVNNLNAGVCRTDPGPQGHFLEANPAMLKIFEADSLEEFLKHPASDTYLDKNSRNEFIDKVFKQGYVKNEEIQLVTLKGRPFWGSLTVVLKKDEKDKPVFYGVLQDITEKKKMLELLQYERIFSKNILDSIGDPLLVLDCQKFTILDVNRKFLEDTGFKKEDVVGKTCDELNLPICPSCSPCDCEEVTKEAKFVEKTYTRKDTVGKSLYVEVTLSPLKDEQGHIIGLIYISRDVTVRKKLEEALKSYSHGLENLVQERTKALQTSEMMFRELFESAQDGILILDAESGNIINTNPFFLNLLECAREELQHRHYTEVPYFTEPPVFEQVFETLKSQVSVSYDDVAIKTCTGKEISVELLASVYFVDSKKVIQCNIRDITERKKVEKIKSEFVSMVSHELRTPLSSIKEGVEIVADGTQGKLNRGQKECLGIALSNITRLNRLIGDILDISKIQSNILSVKLESCDVRSIIEHVSDLIRIEVEKRGMVLVTDYERDFPKVLADKDRLIQVLFNLLNNAVKFTREKSKIMLSCHRAGDFAEFSVKDEGAGITPEEISMLFGKFVQLDSTLVRRVGGTGLGLYISRNFVEAMGGKIWAESKLGVGSIFKFTIPLEKATHGRE